METSQCRSSQELGMTSLMMSWRWSDSKDVWEQQEENLAFGVAFFSVKGFVKRTRLLANLDNRVLQVIQELELQGGGQSHE